MPPLFLGLGRLEGFEGLQSVVGVCPRLRGHEVAAEVLPVVAEGVTDRDRDIRLRGNETVTKVPCR